MCQAGRTAADDERHHWLALAEPTRRGPRRRQRNVDVDPAQASDRDRRGLSCNKARVRRQPARNRLDRAFDVRVRHLLAPESARVRSDRSRDIAGRPRVGAESCRVDPRCSTNRQGRCRKTAARTSWCRKSLPRAGHGTPLRTQGRRTQLEFRRSPVRVPAGVSAGALPGRARCRAIKIDDLQPSRSVSVRVHEDDVLPICRPVRCPRLARHRLVGELPETRSVGPTIQTLALSTENLPSIAVEDDPLAIRRPARAKRFEIRVDQLLQAGAIDVDDVEPPRGCARG